MKTSQLFTSTAIAVLMAGSTLVQDAAARDMLSPGAGRSQAAQTKAAQAKVLFAEDLGSGEAADVYKVKCNARKISADVCDIGPFFDTSFQVAVVGSAGGIQGKAQAKVAPIGGCSTLASVSRAVGNGNLRAYNIYTEVNAPGFEEYDTLVFCTNANGTTENPVITKILDQ